MTTRHFSNPVLDEIHASQLGRMGAHRMHPEVKREQELLDDLHYKPVDGALLNASSWDEIRNLLD